MDFSALDNFLNELTHTKVPFAECRVHKSGKEVYRYAGGVKYSPNYKYYNLYSTSKVITCVAALQLLEKGKYLLTEPLADYLPEFSEMTVKREFTLGDEGRKTAEGVEDVRTIKSTKP